MDFTSFHGTEILESTIFGTQMDSVKTCMYIYFEIFLHKPYAVNRNIQSIILAWIDVESFFG